MPLAQVCTLWPAMGLEFDAAAASQSHFCQSILRLKLLFALIYLAPACTVWLAVGVGLLVFRMMAAFENPFSSKLSDPSIFFCLPQSRA